VFCVLIGALVELSANIGQSSKAALDDRSRLGPIREIARPSHAGGWRR
jgi:hypothetical protein